MPRIKYLLLALVLIPAICACQACGKKNWPAPIAEEERFVWSEMSARVENGCLDITALLSGKVHNLAALTLEVEMRNKACPGCPFVPTSKVRLDPGDSAWERDGALVHVTWCGLQPDMALRWRLVGHSIYTSMEDARSIVHSTPQEGAQD